MSAESHMKEAHRLVEFVRSLDGCVGGHDESVDIVALALQTAEQRGRQQGVECAARVADDAERVKWEMRGKIPSAADIARAIRALAPLPPALPAEAVEKLVEAVEGATLEDTVEGHVVVGRHSWARIEKALAAVRATGHK